MGGIQHDNNNVNTPGELTPRCVVPSLGRDGTSLHDFDTEDEIYNELVPFIHTLYFKVKVHTPCLYVHTVISS